jgi:hypothetical protein
MNEKLPHDHGNIKVANENKPRRGRTPDPKKLKSSKIHNVYAGTRLMDAIIHSQYESLKNFCDVNGLNHNTVYAHTNGSRGMKTPVAKRYGQLLSVRPEWILYGSSDATDTIQPTVGVPLVAIASAGHFLDNSADMLNPIEMIPVPQDLRTYRGSDSFAVRISTDDMDKRFQPGSILLCVRPESAKITLRDGQIVFVMRKSEVGTEQVIRLLREINNEFWLWPESTSPHFQQPWKLKSNSNTIQITIIGVAFSLIQSLDT